MWTRSMRVRFPPSARALHFVRDRRRGRAAELERAIATGKPDRRPVAVKTRRGRRESGGAFALRAASIPAYRWFQGLLLNVTMTMHDMMRHRISREC
jgi:hypothetical protein